MKQTGNKNFLIADTCLTRVSWWPWKMLLNVSQVGWIRSPLKFIALFNGAIVSHLARASTQTVDLKADKES